MQFKRLYWFATGVLLVSFLISMKAVHTAPYNMKLSAFGFFSGDIKRQQPEKGVMPYALKSPLFSDYAHKLRFVKLPDGSKILYNSDSVLQFPIGTKIVKTFFYFFDSFITIFLPFFQMPQGFYLISLSFFEKFK